LNSFNHVIIIKRKHKSSKKSKNFPTIIKPRPRSGKEALTDGVCLSVCR